MGPRLNREGKPNAVIRFHPIVRTRILIRLFAQDLPVPGGDDDDGMTSGGDGA
jgi:hypothetical protein